MPGVWGGLILIPERCCTSSLLSCCWSLYFCTCLQQNQVRGREYIPLFWNDDKKHKDYLVHAYLGFNCCMPFCVIMFIICSKWLCMDILQENSLVCFYMGMGIRIGTWMKSRLSTLIPKQNTFLSQVFCFEREMIG